MRNNTPERHFWRRFRHLVCLGGGRSAGGHCAAILYALRTLARLEGYVQLARRTTTFQTLNARLRSAAAPERQRQTLCALAEVLARVLRCDATQMLERWLRRALAQGREPAHTARQYIIEFF